MKKFWTVFIGFIFILLLVACDNGALPDSETTGGETPIPSSTPSDEASSDSSTTNTPSPSEDDSSYPGPEAAINSDYPGPSLPENLLSEPPNPDVEFPDIVDNTGAVGGVLVREFTDGGFLPLTPLKLVLGQLLYNDEGEPSLFRYNDSSPHAQLLPGGIFLFQNVPPGTYALIIDLGFTEFVIAGEDGFDLVVEVEGGKAINLGQLFIELPE